MIIFNLKINLFCLLLAILIDFILGDPSWLPHPIIYIGKLISKVEKFFRRRYENERLKLPGLFMVIIVAGTAYLLPFVILMLCKSYIYLYIVVNTLILWTTLAAKCLHQAGMEVYYPLKEKNLGEARIKLSYIVGRDTSSLKEEEIIRGDVETIAENTSDGIIAPMVYGLLGGAPLAMLYKGINTMDSMVGYLNEKFRYIGFFPAKIDDVFNFIPARITGILMCLCAFTVKGSIINSFKIMIRDRKNHKSPNCAYPEAATAGALNIQLGGTNTYFGEVIVKPTMGDGKVPLSEDHIKKAVVLMYGSEVLLAGLMSLIFVLCK